MSEMIPKYSERYVGKHPALGAPYGGQATPNDLYYPAALQTARLRAQVSDDLRKSERRARRIYQVLALGGWAAAVAMGVFG